MIQILSKRETEFLNRLKALIIEYNAEIHCCSTKNIQIIIDAHLNQEWENPIRFSNYLDEFDIDNLFEETRINTQRLTEP